MEWIANQPVFFATVAEGCSCDESTYPQLVHNTDISQVQFAIDPCPGAEQLMPDPNFEDDESWSASLDNWSILDGLLCGTDLTLGTASAYQFTVGSYYQINLTVVSISSGGSIQVQLGDTVLGYITSTGTYTFYGIAGSLLGNSGIILNPFVAGTDICINEVTSYEVLTNVGIAIYDSNDTYINSIFYSTDPEYFVFASNSVTINIDWASLGAVDGCYYLCLLDPCENTNGQNYPASILNPNMTIDEEGETGDWDYSPLCWSAQLFSIIGTSSGGSNDLGQPDVFDSLTNSYCILVSVTAGTSINLDVYFGTALVGTITSIGNHTICGTPEGNGTLNFDLTSGVGVVIDSVRPLAPDGEDEPFTCNKTSNTFKLGDYSNACTHIVNGCNNENGLGFIFEDSGFSPRLRLEAKLKNSKYSSERSVYEDSEGSKKNTYYSRRKQKSFVTDLQPEYIHDFLSLAIGFDNFFIDRNPYFVDDDEYNVEYSDASDDVGKVSILVSMKTQNIKNTNCTGEENVCTLGDNFLLKVDETAEYITQVSGGRIIISG